MLINDMLKTDLQYYMVGKELNISGGFRGGGGSKCTPFGG